MLPPTCYTCGCDTAAVAVLYEYMVRKRRAAAAAAAPPGALAAPEDHRDIFEALGVELYCCRIRLATNVRWADDWRTADAQ
jgi:DNA-directed RNA polymerase subunit N (RpoN/RPB10)